MDETTSMCVLLLLPRLHRRLASSQIKRKADQAMADGHYAKAVKLYTRAIKMNPKSGNPRLGL